MPHYHLSLTTDQPVAIKTRIATRGTPAESTGSGANSGAEMELRDAVVTVDELNAVVQHLEIQIGNLEKHLAAIIRLYEKQGTKQDSSFTPPGFWKKLAMILHLVPRPQDQRPPEQLDPD